MRLFEVLLTLSCFVLLMDLWFVKRNAKKTDMALAIGSSILFVVQLVVEGYRWQMLLIYGLTGLFILIIPFKHVKKKMAIKIGKALRYSMASFSVILLALSVGFK